MTDRIAEKGAVQYAQDNTSAPTSRLGGAGWIQGAISDAVAAGKASLNGSRLGGKGRIYALAASAGPSFLFANGEPGLWLDFWDTTKTFQDSAGTVPATTVGDVIGKVTDKSGRGNDATQGTTGAKALLSVNAAGKKVATFDGFDDFSSTAAIDFTGTDKITVFAGVRKTSDAAAGYICELSSSIATNAGAFVTSSSINAVGSLGGYYRAGSRGTAANSSSQSSITDNVYPAPNTAVLTASHNIAGDSSILRVNGTQITAGTGDQGLGNFGNYPLYVGMRGGTTGPFAGDISSLIVVGRLCTAAEIAAVEAYIASNMGVTL